MKTLLKVFQTELSQYPTRLDVNLKDRINLTGVTYYKRKLKGKVKNIGRVDKEKKMDIYLGYYENGIYKPTCKKATK